MLTEAPLIRACASRVRSLIGFGTRPIWVFSRSTTPIIILLDHRHDPPRVRSREAQNLPSYVTTGEFGSCSAYGTAPVLIGVNAPLSVLWEPLLHPALVVPPPVSVVVARSG